MFLFESLVYIYICLYFWIISDRWKLLQIPNLVLSISGTVCLFFMPESPRFLVAQQRYDDARNVFKLIGKINGIRMEEIDNSFKDFKFLEEE
jgi:hypothetical protein